MENNNSLKKSERNKFISIILLLSILLIALLIFIFIDRKEPQNNEVIEENNAELDLSRGDYEGVNLENNEEVLILAPGASPVTTGGEVLTETGSVARNDVAVMSPEAPHQTNFLVEDDLPEESINIEIREDSFSPKSFTTSPNTATFISFSSKDGGVHTITFDDPSLSALAVLVGPNQTKGILFKAPSESGTYAFRCITPGHADKGEIGEMVVR